MFHVKFLVISLLVSVVELTPIVTPPPAESVPTSITDDLQIVITTSTTEAAPVSQVSANVTNIPEEGESIAQENATETGQIDKSEPTIVSVIIATNSSSPDPEALNKPVNSIVSSVSVNQTKGQGLTTPELITNTTVPTANVEVEVTQLSVTSNPIILKKGNVIDKLESTVSPSPLLADNQTANSIDPVRIISANGNNASNVTEGNYRDKAPPEYHPYIEEILRTDTSHANATQSAPIRIKSQSHQSPQNSIDSHPYGQLPKFAEKEIDKLRLNHWRVHQILKGDLHKDSKLGLLGTTKEGNNNLQGKYQQPSHFLGQKRTSSTSAAAVKSSVDQDEFHSSILASEHDAVLMENEKSKPSKVRTFFNWISNPLKKKPNAEHERLRQARAQQPILPFALGYRGDFLFW